MAETFEIRVLFSLLYFFLDLCPSLKVIAVVVFPMPVVELMILNVRMYMSHSVAVVV